MKKKRSLAFLLIFTILTSLCGCSASAITVREKRASEAMQKAESFWAEQNQHQLGEPVIFTDYVQPLAFALQYPVIGYDEIDYRIESIVGEIRTAFEQEYLPDENTPGEKRRSNQPIATLFLGYETYLTDEDHLSLLFFETTETAADGMSPHTQIHAYHFDLSEDREIPAEELMWENFQENASLYAQKYFTSTEPYSQCIFGDYATRLAPENGYFDRFTFTADGVLFHFEKYTLFPGSLGVVTLTIPYEDMRVKSAPAAEDPVTPPASITEKKMVAITYDDGPNPIHTNAILDILEKYDARATFFDLGYLVEKYPDVVKREVALGCEVGSHSWDHDNFNKLSETAIKEDVARTDAVFQKVLDKSPSSFRPPYGNCSDQVKNLIPLPIYLWSVDTLDWKSRNAQAVINEVKKIGDLDGKVILMHGIYSSTAEATAYLVPYLQEQGYELVTVSELVWAKYGEYPQNSKIYGYHYFQ